MAELEVLYAILVAGGRIIDCGLVSERKGRKLSVRLFTVPQAVL